MTQLVEGQHARLDVGESLPCRVVAFNGPDVVLRLEAHPEETLERRTSAYLLVESDDGRIQAVRGEVGLPEGDEIVLRLTDDFRLGQRRAFSRAPLALPARVRPGNGSEVATVTRDLSAGGVCVAREGLGRVDGTLTVRIQVADHEVVAKATAVRVTPSELGLRFEEIQLDDRMLLASLALAYHRRR